MSNKICYDLSRKIVGNLDSASSYYAYKKSDWFAFGVFTTFTLVGLILLTVGLCLSSWTWGLISLGLLIFLPTLVSAIFAMGKCVSDHNNGDIKWKDYFEFMKHAWNVIINND